MTETVDVVTIGMGPGGEALASRLAAEGLAVVGVEARLLGGECPYYGCIPSKMMVRAANSLAEGRRVNLLAGRGEVSPSLEPAAARIRDEATDGWDDTEAVERFESTGGRFVRGHGRLTGPTTVRVGDTEFSARRAIVLNTGTVPAVPPVEGLHDTPFWTNREALTVERAPRSLAVLGGGAIGVELGQAFARFGTRVTIVEAGPSLLGVEEPEAASIVSRACAEDGVDVRTGARVTEVAWDGQEFTLHLQDAMVRADRLLVSTGRRTNLGDLGLEAVGLDSESHFLDPDGRMRVADGIYAVGDITGRGQFTHVSMYQADIAARDILGVGGPEAQYHAIPHVTFTDPEVGSVGLTEARAREQGLSVLTGTTQLPDSARGWVHKVGNTGLIKLVADAERDVLVGATSVGPWGGEVLSALSVAVHARTPVATLRQLPFAFPTFHRAIGDALARLRPASA